MRAFWGTICCGLLAIAVAAPPTQAVKAQQRAEPGATFQWGLHSGTAADDRAGDLAIFRGKSYVARTVATTSGGKTDQDIVLERLDDTGHSTWQVQIGTSNRTDVAAGVAAGAAGVVLLHDRAAKRGSASKPSFRVELYDPNGVSTWVVDSGSLGLPGGSYPQDVVTTGNDAYVVGYSIVRNGKRVRSFVQRLALVDGSDKGHLVGRIGRYATWTGVEKIGRDLVLIGEARTPSDQIVVRRIDRVTFKNKWTYTLDTPKRERAGEASVRGSRIYVSGTTNGRLGGQRRHGGVDGVVVGLSSSGVALWKRQVGTRGNDAAPALAADPDGPILAQRGRVGDVRLTGLDRSGRQLWSSSLGGGTPGVPRAAEWNSHGVRVLGNTGRDLYGPSAGRSDVFMARYAVALSR